MVRKKLKFLKKEENGINLLNFMVQKEIKSLILDPYGKNLGVATISRINPHLGEIRAAMRRLPPHPGE